MLSLITTSTLPWLSSVMAWVKPSTASTRAPASRATCAQLLVTVSPATLPLMSASDLTELSLARVTMTPSPTEYGSDRSYYDPQAVSTTAAIRSTASSALRR